MTLIEATLGCIRPPSCDSIASESKIENPDICSLLDKPNRKDVQGSAHRLVDLKGARWQIVRGEMVFDKVITSNAGSEQEKI